MNPDVQQIIQEMAKGPIECQQVADRLLCVPKPSNSSATVRSVTLVCKMLAVVAVILLAAFLLRTVMATRSLAFEQEETQ